MKTIHRYDIEITDLTTLEMPNGSSILSNPKRSDRLDYGITLWANVDTEEEARAVTIAIVGTGNALPEEIENSSFLGTVLFADEGAVWHVFQVYVDDPASAEDVPVSPTPDQGETPILIDDADGWGAEEVGPDGTPVA